MFLLKSYKSPLPGNYSYIQTDGIRCEFKAQPFIEEIAKSVSLFRRANKLPRATMNESLEDVDIYNCAIRGNSPEYCFEADSFLAARAGHPWFRQDCPTCGTKIQPTQ